MTTTVWEITFRNDTRGTERQTANGGVTPIGPGDESRFLPPDQKQRKGTKKKVELEREKRIEHQPVGQRAPLKEVTSLPVFILIPGFKVREGSEEFEEFRKGQSGGD